MFPCPRCRQSLKSAKSPKGRFLRCARCGGRACTVAFLRKVVAREEVNRAWNAVHDRSHTAMMDCPSCEQQMRQVSIRPREDRVELDACRSCQLIGLVLGFLGRR